MIKILYCIENNYNVNNPVNHTGKYVVHNDKIYRSEEENEKHFVINGVGFFKKRFIDITDKPITKLLI